MLSSNGQTSIHLPRSTLLPHLNLFIINIDYLKPGAVTTRTLFGSNEKGPLLPTTNVQIDAARYTHATSESVFASHRPPSWHMAHGPIHFFFFFFFQNDPVEDCYSVLNSGSAGSSSLGKLMAPDSGHLRSSGLMLQKTETEAI